MKTCQKCLWAAVLSLALLFSSSGSAVAKDRMTYEEYLTELTEYQTHLADLENEMERVRGEIDQLRAEIADLEAQIKSTWDEIYATIGVTEADVSAFKEELAGLERRIDAIARLSPDQLLDRKDEIDEIEQVIDGKLQESAAKLTAILDELNGMKVRVAAVRTRIPKPKHDLYTVLIGDCLWRISGKSDVYGDPWKWLRIYSANRSQIKDPDLIYSGQVFRIPRSIAENEHLVQRGEFLAKIAGYPEVYGDPFKWTEIYQANKVDGFIKDPNLIYPEQILVIP